MTVVHAPLAVAVATCLEMASEAAVAMAWALQGRVCFFVVDRYAC